MARRARASAVVGQAFRVWWGDFMLLLLFNIAWLALQFPVFTGPVATAAMYVIARRIVDGELTEPRHGREALRNMLWPGLQWGALNLAVVLVVVGNFWAYREAVGPMWVLFRLTWATAGLGWLVVNLFYWPFWLVAQDRTVRNTLRNSAIFVMRRPGFALGVALISAVLIVVSILVVLPMAAAAMAWIALIGVLAVDEEVSGPREPVHQAPRVSMQ